MVWGKSLSAQRKRNRDIKGTFDDGIKFDQAQEIRSIKTNGVDTATGFPE